MVRDHKALEWFYSFIDLDGMIARWIKRSGQFEFETKHGAGKKTSHAFCLSRIAPDEENSLQRYQHECRSSLRKQLYEHYCKIQVGIRTLELRG